jgi:hypothetical protein
MHVVTETGSALLETLRAGRLGCPACQGPLRPWGVARERAIRVAWGPDRIVQPRRARCSRCRVTHVLLPDWTVVRRAYEAATIRLVVTEHAHGMGYRRIALRMRLPESTVRDWLRASRRSAPHLRGLQGGPGDTVASAVAALERVVVTEPEWRLRELDLR